MARTVQVILEAAVQGYKQKMAEAAKVTDEVATAAEKTGSAVAAAEKQSKGLADSLRGMGRSAKREFEVMQDTALANEAAWSGVQNQLALVGAAAAGVGALAIREFASFDQAVSGVASTGGDAKNNIQALRQAAIDMGADTAFSATEAAQGIEELARAGVDAESVLAGGLAGALDLAAAGQIGVAEAAGIASTAMTQFKLRGDQIPHLADLLAAGAGKAMGGVDDLGQALKQSGLVASQFGLSIEETVGGLSAFAAAGLLGSDAGTSMKSMLLALANPAGKTAKKMEELGIYAYDAQGSFIGLEGLAGVLQERLGSLTDAQRQQALAQIFGTDAIRAASILYENGAEGIREWTDAVNDSGYATETATELQNNLIGDLEKLGGSWSTLAIQMGETADGPLRVLVQGLTGLLDVAGETPGAAQNIMILSGGIAGLALGTAGLMKGISTYATFRTNLAELTALNPRIGKTANLMGKLGKLAGGAVLAFAGLQVVGAIGRQFATTAVSVEETAKALERFNAASDKGAFDRLFRDADDPTRGLAKGIDDLDSALANIARYGSSFDNIDAKLEGVVGGIIGVEGASSKLRDVFNQLDDTITQLPAEEAAAAFAEISSRATEAGLSTEDLIRLFPDYAEQTRNFLRDSSNEWTSYADGPEAVAAVMRGELPEGLAIAAEGALVAATSMSTLGQSEEQAAEAAEEHEKALQRATDALSAAITAAQTYGNMLLALSGSQIGLEAAIDNASEAVKENGRNLDITTEAGRANRTALDQLGAAGQSLISTMAEQNATNDEMVQASARARQAFLDTAEAMGMEIGEATELADALFAIPTEVGTWLGTQGLDAAHRDVELWEKALDELSEEEKTEFFAVLDGQSEATVKAALDELARNRNATISVNAVVGGAGAPLLGRTVMRAEGGPVFGAGTSTSDSIPALLSNGEYVLRTWAARMIGYGNLDQLNRTGQLPERRASGGAVGVVPAHATSGTHSLRGSGSSAAYHDNRVYNLTSREALEFLTHTLRDSDVDRYASQGVH